MIKKNVKAIALTFFYRLLYRFCSFSLLLKQLAGYLTEYSVQ